MTNDLRCAICGSGGATASAWRDSRSRITLAKAYGATMKKPDSQAAHYSCVITLGNWIKQKEAKNV